MFYLLLMIIHFLCLYVFVEFEYFKMNQLCCHELLLSFERMYQTHNQASDIFTVFAYSVGVFQRTFSICLHKERDWLLLAVLIENAVL